MSRNTVNITVIICSYNRSHLLAKTLESLVDSRVPDLVEWEIIVVDNNSQDQTRVVVESLSIRFPNRIRYAFEPRPGKSFALNRGIQEALGEILFFTDDDVIVDPKWIANLMVNLEDRAWDGVSGRTLPERGFVPPRWLELNDRNLATLGCFDRGQKAFELKEAPFGNNMAYRREVFQKYGGFCTELGPQPGNLIRSEDSDFGRRVLAAGGRIRYEPSAVLFHAVPRNRIKRDYFLSWWFYKGRSEVRAFGFENRAALSFLGVPLILFRRLIAWTIRWMYSLQPTNRFLSKTNMWFVCGQILECYAKAHSPNETGAQVAMNHATKRN